MSHELEAVDSLTTLEAEQSAASQTSVVIPLVAEELEVGKRVVQTGVVRLTKHTEQHTETVTVPLTQVQWHVEHVPMNVVVKAVPAVRQDGETTIYPLIEERVTVLREIVLVEEVRVTRIATTTKETSSHVLNRETVTEERLPGSV